MRGDDAVTGKDTASLHAGVAVSDTVRWRARVHVDKFDDDQVRWVSRKTGIMVPDGACLLANVDPYATVDAPNNLLTTAGLTRITSLITAAGGQGITNTSARIGVGDDATAAAVGQTDLQAGAGGTHRQFEVMDATYPLTSAGVITLRSTFTTGEANFVWNEWCVDVGAPTVAAGTTVAALMVNRKVQSLGTKVTGSWVLTATITLA